jgi:hypothetical protein
LQANLTFISFCLKPLITVGVVGSGKGMTQYGSKQRHKFNGNGAE